MINMRDNRGNEDILKSTKMTKIILTKIMKITKIT